MYTIKLNSDKTLTTTIKATLMQKENGVDKIQFLLPQTYLECDLKDYIITMVWTDPNGNYHTKLLEQDEETYKDYIRCVFTATKEFLSNAGSIEVWINAMNPDLDDDVPYKTFRSYSTTIRVEKPTPYVDFADFETIEAMKQAIKDIGSVMPTDVVIDEETDNLHLVHNDAHIGDGVEILVPTDYDNDDGAKDGVIDLDSIPDDEDPTFIELEDDGT